MLTSSWDRRWFLLARTTPAKPRHCKRSHFGMWGCANGTRNTEEKPLRHNVPAALSIAAIWSSSYSTTSGSGSARVAAAQSGVTKDIPPGRIVAGSPHMPHREWLKMEACLPKLPEMRETLAALQRRVEALEKKGKETL